MIAETKYCSGCQQNKPFESFTPVKSGRGAGGRESRCKSCLADAYKDYAARHRRGHAERQKRYRDKLREENLPQKLIVALDRATLIERHHVGMQKILAERAEKQRFREETIRAGYAAETPLEEIAAAIEKPIGYVLRKSLSLGLRLSNGRPTEEKKREFVDLRLCGYTIIEIWKETGYSTAFVRSALRDVGLSGRLKSDYSHIRAVALARLENLIIKPGYEKHLQPLLEFRGSANLGRVHRLWNFVVAMHEAECETIADGLIRFSHNPEYSHLCGPPNSPQHTSFYGFTSRIIQSPKIKRLDPRIYDYAKLLNPRPFELVRVSEVAHHRGHAWWRRYELDGKPRKLKLASETRAPLVYPFLIHDGGLPEHELLRLVNEAVPKYLSPETRADICQDLIVGILSGDFDRSNLALPAKEMTKRVIQMFPTKYGPMSLDAPLAGMDDLRLIDVVSDGSVAF